MKCVDKHFAWEGVSATKRRALLYSVVFNLLCLALIAGTSIGAACAVAATSRSLGAADFTGYKPSVAQFASGRGALTIANHRFQRGVELATYGGAAYSVAVSLRLARLTGYHALTFYVGLEDRTAIDHVAHFQVTQNGRIVYQQSLRKGQRVLRVGVMLDNASSITFSAYSEQGDPSYVLIADPLALNALPSAPTGAGTSSGPAKTRYVHKTEFAGINNQDIAYLKTSPSTTIGGIHYSHALQLEPCGGSYYTVGASINTRPFQKYRALTVIAGMRDGNPGGAQSHVFIEADGHTVFQANVAQGIHPVHVRLPVAGVQEYSFKAYRTHGDCQYVLFAEVTAVQ